MIRLKRVSITCLALAVAAGGLPGCVVAIGTGGKDGAPSRMDLLESRIRVAEERLGIPAPVDTKQ